MKYARARDEEGKPVRCPRCNTWVFHVFDRKRPYLFCVGCEWFVIIQEEESVQTEPPVEGAEGADQGEPA